MMGTGGGVLLVVLLLLGGGNSAELGAPKGETGDNAPGVIWKPTRSASSLIDETV
jgi:hypothetical protein